MPVLLPFQAFRSSRPAVYLPGQESPPPIDPATLRQDSEVALFIYHQRFRFPGESEESVRYGVMGLLNRQEANVFPHEKTFPDRVEACSLALQSREIDPGSLWMWCEDGAGTLHHLLTQAPYSAPIQAADNFGCLHQLWPVTDAARIEELQVALQGKALFLADGHHRFTAGWNLATIQIRGEALRSLPPHRLVTASGGLAPLVTQPVEDPNEYLRHAPPGCARWVVVTDGPVFRGLEHPRGVQIETLLPGAAFQPIGDAFDAIAAVEAGQARMAILAAATPLEDIESRARRGLLFPPKSTNFYPKLAAGLILYRDSLSEAQNEKLTPPVAHPPGVRNPSS